VTGANLTAPHLGAERVAEVGRLPRGTRTDLTASVRAFRRSGLDADRAVLISDGLAEPADLEAAIAELATAPAAAFVHLVDGAAAPSLPASGPVELHDRETGERLLVDLTPALAGAYAKRSEGLAAVLRERCAAQGVDYVRAPTTIAPIDLLFGAGRDAELVTL
jgi:hypothetical protein